MNLECTVNRIVYFDYCALFTFIILLGSTIFRKMTKGKQNISFLVMIIISILAVIADIFAIKMDSIATIPISVKYIAHAFYLFFHALCPFLYLFYLIFQSDRWYFIQKNKFLITMILLPIATVVISLILNAFYPFVFYFDALGYYQRGKGMILLYFSAMFYTFYGLFYLFSNKKAFNQRQYISLLAQFPFLLAAVIFQLLMPQYVVEMFANACGLLFISMMVQRPEENIDIITGLSKLNAYVHDMKRSFLNKEPIKIIMINITNYNTLYRMFGYDEMNTLLKNIASHLIIINKREKLKANLYYLGDGKFRFVIDYRNFNKVEDTADLLNRMLKHNFYYNHMDLNLHSTVCIINCPEDIDDVDSLLLFGNELMNPKFYSGNVLHASDVYNKDRYSLMKDIDSIIERGLANHNFHVYYQPIYSVSDDHFHSAEALLRLEDENYGFISPEIFIPAAEKSGAIHRIGSFVLEEVCQFIASDEYKELNIDYIEINLSVAQCMENNLSKMVLEILQKYEIQPDQINLEITETAASYSQNTLEKNLTELNNAGIHFSLDDFGTGYSNMRRIASLPFHIVKIDKSFANILDNPKIEVVLRNTIQMIKALDMQIVVEGVETENTAALFSELECEYIQGFYYSEPISKSNFIQFVKQHNENC